MTEHSALKLVGYPARCCWCGETVEIVKDPAANHAVLATHAGVDDLLCPMSGALLTITAEETEEAAHE